MSKVFSGAKGSLKINGRKIAYIGSITINEENELTDIDVLDQLEVAEHAETSHKVSATVNLFKIDENSVSSLGLRADNIKDILSQGEMTLEIYNSVNDKVEYEMSGVKFSGGSGSLDARGVFSGTWNFKGRVGKGL